MAVWEDHLLPPLTGKEAARLAHTCKALGVVVRDHFVGDIGNVRIQKLQAALTALPRARSVTPYCDEKEGPDDEEREALVKWLSSGEHGRHITTITTMAAMSRTNNGANDIIHEALQRGALPSLTAVAVNLESETQRAALTIGDLGGIHELRLTVSCDDEMEDLEEKLVVLGTVRDLRDLTKLDLEVSIWSGDHDLVQWRPFIPSSLKALSVDTEESSDSLNRSLLRALPDMLETSGARLDRLELKVDPEREDIGDWLTPVGEALYLCSSTLKSFSLVTDCDISLADEAEDYEGQVERLRTHWADVLACLSTCRELEQLVLPHADFEPLFPLGTAFGRLTDLEISVYERERPPDAGVVGLWELMASGGLPVLAKLSLRLRGRWGGMKEAKARVALALEAVAGTLTHLHVHKWEEGDEELQSDDVGMAFHLGMAMGKLRRLKDLTLQLSRDGCVYDAMAQGLAASGEDRPLPRLWRLVIHSLVDSHADLLASLVLPSVQVFVTSHEETRAALLTANALRRAGYKHVWAVDCPDEFGDGVRAIAGCRIGDRELYGYALY
jgi:hypothetical protein